MEELYPSFSRSPVWEEMESEKAAVGAMAGLGPAAQHQAHGVSSGAATTGDESSDSDGEHEGPQKLIRKVSTSGQIRSKMLTRSRDIQDDSLAHY